MEFRFRLNWLYTLIAAFWSLLIIVSIIFDIRQSHTALYAQGLSQTRASFIKDYSYRLWNTMHGGVYVPVTPTNPPNPYLKVPHRDIETKEGLKLTLINPAYMTRQTHELSKDKFGTKGHITSLNLINPSNVPSEWEKRALMNFEQGSEEFSEIVYTNHQTFFRYMAPLKTEQGCLKCHGQQGYKVGQIRGGISVELNLTPANLVMKQLLVYSVFIYISVWLVVILLLLVVRKVLERNWKLQIQNQDSLNQEKSQLDLILNNLKEAVVMTDNNGCILIINSMGLEMTGCKKEDVIGKLFYEVFLDDKGSELVELQKLIVEGMNKGTLGFICDLNFKLKNKQGKVFDVMCNAAPVGELKDKMVGIILIFRDVTLEKSRQEDRARISKLESLGVLAGGIAHDFNNLLAGILGNLELVLMEMPPSDDRDILTEAQQASIRARELTGQLLTFAKGGLPVKENVHIEKDIMRAAEFVLRGTNSKVQYNIPDDLWAVCVDRNQISQVIQNLVLNAHQAMQGPGTININLANVPAGTIDNPKIQSIDCVSVSIKDNGVGISEELQKKIFDPYFSTKAKGSGLGLAVCHSIISKHGGIIKLDSIPGQGSTFTIFLPATFQDISTIDKDNKESKNFSFNVLVLDDEKSILKIYEKMLTRLGCRVTKCSEGQEAIRLYKSAMEDQKKFDLIILDLTIPGSIGGVEVLTKIQEIDPKVIAVVSTGYSENPFYMKAGFKAMLRKPFKLEELKNILHALETDIQH